MLNVTITKTQSGIGDYIQIMSEDQTSLNIVLIADEIQVSDHRLDVEEQARDLFAWSADPHNISECEEYIRKLKGG